MPKPLESLPADTVSDMLPFKYMNPEELDQFLSRMECEEYEQNELIIQEGDLHPYLYLIIAGTATVNVGEPGGNDVYVSAIGEGEIFGEAGIFLNVRRTANVVSVDTTRVARIHRDQLLAFIRQYPATGIKILMTIIYSLLRKLRESNMELAYERKNVMAQDDIDDIVASVMREAADE